MKKLILLFIFCVCISSYSIPLLFAQSPLKDYGDAPEGALAYPASGVFGQFPTCISVGPLGYVEHTNCGTILGPGLDYEGDGNGGACPGFNPYDLDECKGDGDAGLTIPGAFTIVNGQVVPCQPLDIAPLGGICTGAAWGTDIDIILSNGTIWNELVNVIIDWDQNGIWGTGISVCPPNISVPEHVLVDWPVPSGFSGLLSWLQPPGFIIGPNPGYVWARITIAEQPVGINWDGSGSFEDGESEDYLLLVKGEEIDFGDAPDGIYPTLLSSNGAGHTNDGITFLGAGIDVEADGQPNANADGDDMNNVDDEDGVTFASKFIPGQSATMQITASVNCLLNAWIDFNQMNGWADAGEQICTNVQLGAGLNALAFQVPANAALGQTYARFRVNTNGNLSYAGQATEGEVEDYILLISLPTNTMDFGDAPDGPYPNPSRGLFELFFGNRNNLPETIEIFNSQGIQVPFQVTEKGTSTLSIDLRGEPAGIYLIRVYSDTYTFSGKLWLIP